MRAIVLISLLSIACYQTSTSDNRTVRVNTITGKSEKLVGGQWIPIAEPRATARPLAPLTAAECADLDRRRAATGSGMSLRTAQVLGMCP